MLLLVFAAGAAVCWLFGTQGADRFLAPAFPAVAALVGWLVTNLADGRARWMAGALLVLLALTGVWGTARDVAHNYPAAPRQIARGSWTADIETYAHLKGIEVINEWSQVDPLMKVLFVGEARQYGALPRVVAPTVFDQHPLLLLPGEGADGPAVAESLTRAGYTHILYNEMELARLKRYGRHGWEDGEALEARVEALRECCARYVHEFEMGPTGYRLVVFQLGGYHE